jgi:hypothetical protein
VLANQRPTSLINLQGERPLDIPSRKAHGHLRLVARCAEPYQRLAAFARLETADLIGQENCRVPET